ncbi:MULTISPECIES: TonB-dependent receptor [unclassified Acidiphilium]|uniref:TonB-dependent receptor n=1 Tax=unclassified Acidiphilium TaxID=2617493 RepID=UPI000BC53F4C|nr:MULTISPECIES: TonB-dependent receptor [unclassified Acidiphilium]OYV55872.1 MAG: TonB-dependent receptor [Acidiphilium sp. 20-67-58]HQT62560.1 TonB-dependent receptor [Acidiphilium sp.]
MKLSNIVSVSSTLRTALLAGASVFALMPHAHAQTVSAGQVSATATTKYYTHLGKSSVKLTKKKIFKSEQSQAVVSRQDIQALGPSTSSAGALSAAPGVQIRGYGGNSDTARYQIQLRGSKVGWSSTNGDAERNGLTVLFDGIPMNNTISHNGQWDSNEIPITQLFSGINVIYGPGNPDTRWFDSVGGTINYVPVQPTKRPHYQVGIAYGSQQTENLHFIFDTGEYNGWSGVIGGGYAGAKSYWGGTSVGHYSWPAQSHAIYAKLVKDFSNGSLSFAVYNDNNVEYAPRPNFIPLTPIPGVTVTGYSGSPLFSQQTSGFYGTGTPDIWFKQLQVRDTILYSKMSVALSKDMTFHNNIWYRWGHRVHYRVNNYGTNSPLAGAAYAPNSTNSEYYYPTTNQYGDNLYFDYHLPYNDIKFGGYVIYERYYSPYRGYNYLGVGGSTQQNPAQIQKFTVYTTYANAFLQDTIHPFKGFSITPGIAEVSYHTDFHNDLPIGGTNQIGAGDGSKTFVRAEPSIGLRYEVTPWAALYGSMAISYQNPTDNAFGANQQNPVNLSILKPTQARDYEIGLKLFSDHVPYLHHATLNLNYFNDTLTDEAISIYHTNIVSSSLAAANARLQGVQLDASVEPNFHWRGFVNASFDNNKYLQYETGGVVYHNEPISYNPNLLLNFGLNYRTFVGSTLVTLGFLDQYTGSQHYFNNNTNNVSSRKLSGFNVANLSITANIPVPKSLSRGVKVLELSFNINNLFDTKYNDNGYITAGGYFGTNSLGTNTANTILVQPGAPRQFIAGLTAKF